MLYRDKGWRAAREAVLFAAAAAHATGSCRSMATGSAGAAAARRRVSAQRLLAAAGAGSAISRADIYAGDLGVSAVAMLGRAVDRRAPIVVTAGWPDVGRA